MEYILIVLYLIVKNSVFCLNCQFDLGIIQLYEGQVKQVHLIFPQSYDYSMNNLKFSNTNWKIANVINYSRLSPNVSVHIKGQFLGRAFLLPLLTDSNDNNNTETGCSSAPLQMVVKRKPNLITKVFRTLVISFVIANTFLFGCKLDAMAFKQFIWKPYSVIVSMACQIFGMPLLAYGLTKLFALNLADRMGLFLVGCSPGGGSSNMWTFILGGDLLLSILLTFINTLAAFGSMPMWFTLLGPYIFPDFTKSVSSSNFYSSEETKFGKSPPNFKSYLVNEPMTSKAYFNYSSTQSTPSLTPQSSKIVSYLDTSIRIPYDKIFVSLLSVSIPPLVGISLQKVKPLWAAWLARWAKPFTVSMLVLIVIMGIWSNTYIFRVLRDPEMGGSWKLLGAALGLPWGGYLMGYTACLLVNFVYAIASKISKSTRKEYPLMRPTKKFKISAPPILVSNNNNNNNNTLHCHERKIESQKTIGNNRDNFDKMDVGNPKAYIMLNQYHSRGVNSDYQTPYAETVVPLNSGSNSIEIKPNIATSNNHNNHNHNINNFMENRFLVNNNNNDDVIIPNLTEEINADDSLLQQEVSDGVEEREITLPIKDQKVTLIPWEQRIAIAIETGLQNAGLAILLLWSIYPQPESDLAITVPVACTIFTPIPLLAFYTARELHRRYNKSRLDKMIISDPL